MTNYHNSALMQQVITELIALKQRNVFPSHLSIGNLLIADDGRIILSDLLFNETLNGTSIGEEEETVKAFAELSYHLCCGQKYSGGDIELNLRDEVPYSLESFLKVLLTEHNSQMNLTWTLDTLAKIQSGEMTGLVSVPEEVKQAITEEPKNVPPKPSKTKIKFNSDQKTTAPVDTRKRSKKSNKNLVACVVIVVIGAVAGALILMTDNTKPVDDPKKGNTVVLTKEGDSSPAVESNTAPLDSKPAFTLRKPLTKPELNLAEVKSRLPANLPHDFLRGDQIPEGWVHDWNLGPTGARGWMYQDKKDTSEARQIKVTKIDPGSPADGYLNVGDVILGVEEELFTYDPRVQMGKAVGDVEASDGDMSFIVYRNGAIERVKIKLPVLGSYTHTTPFNCSKSKLIIEKGCEAIIADRNDKNKKKHELVQCYNSLALLASGNEKYLPYVRDHIEKLKSTNLKTSHYTWKYGPANILVAEYILITGDTTAMELLNRLTKDIVEGQSIIGSWGHKFIFPDGRLGGYGMINAPGIPLATSLVLARKAGVKVPGLDKAIDKTARLLRFYVDKGSIPYGDHPPWNDRHDDNGKNGAAAILFNLLGDKEAVEFFSKMSLACYGTERDGGHTGNFFNILWAMPGVALSGPHATGSWMNQSGWYYDLARTWNGSFIHQGPPAENYDNYKFWDTTGCMILAYTQSLKLTGLTGKYNSIKPLSSKESQQVVQDARGWNNKYSTKAFDKNTDAELLEKLGNWSPVIRERAAKALAERKTDNLPKLIEILSTGDLYAKRGACEALRYLKRKASPAVAQLVITLDEDDMWLRVRAAKALKAIGPPAATAAPKLIEMYVKNNRVKDPRLMEQRYLSEVLFSRFGLLKYSLEDVDMEKLIAAVKLGLKNEDGKARSSVSEIYNRFTLREIRPLLPAIRKAIIEPSESGIMFSSGVRLAGLDIYSKLKIKEGKDLCMFYLLNQRDHGSKKRIPTVLTYLERYGTHAQFAIPKLKEMMEEYLRKRRGFGTLSCLRSVG